MSHNDQPSKVAVHNEELKRHGKLTVQLVRFVVMAFVLYGVAKAGVYFAMFATK